MSLAMQPYAPVAADFEESIEFSTNDTFGPSDTEIAMTPFHNGDKDFMMDTPILYATAIPDTIRPPQTINYEDEPPTVIKRMSILVAGLFLTYLALVNFIVSEFLIQTKYMNHQTIFWFSAAFYFFAVFLTLGGSIWGAMRGQWRFLVPGLILSHVGAFLIHIVT